MFDSQPEDLGVEDHFTQLVPVLGLIMYILTTLEFFFLYLNLQPVGRKIVALKLELTRKFNTVTSASVDPFALDNDLPYVSWAFKKLC